MHADWLPEERPPYSDAFYALRHQGRSPSRSPTPPNEPWFFAPSRSPSPAPLEAPMLQPAPLEVPMLDLQAMILRSPTPQGVGMIPELSPPPLRLERPPVPLLARRSSPLERGAAVTNRPEPSLTVSMQVSCNLSMSPRLAATFIPEDEISMFAPLFSACYRPRALTFDPRTVPQAVPTFPAPPFLPVPLVPAPTFSLAPMAPAARIPRLPTPKGVGILERSLPLLRYERPPVPLLARRSSRLERGLLS
jgi:hypothetical protein